MPLPDLDLPSKYLYFFPKAGKTLTIGRGTRKPSEVVPDLCLEDYGGSVVAAVQAALGLVTSDSEINRIHFLPGTYEVDASIRIELSKDVFLTGAGKARTVFVTRPDTPIVAFDVHSPVFFVDVSVDGNGGQQPSKYLLQKTPEGGLAKDAQGNYVYALDARNRRQKNLDDDKQGRVGIKFNGTKGGGLVRVTVRNNRLYNVFMATKTGSKITCQGQVVRFAFQKNSTLIRSLTPVFDAFWRGRVIRSASGKLSGEITEIISPVEIRTKDEWFYPSETKVAAFAAECPENLIFYDYTLLDSWEDDSLGGGGEVSCRFVNGTIRGSGNYGWGATQARRCRIKNLTVTECDVAIGNERGTDNVFTGLTLQDNKKGIVSLNGARRNYYQGRIDACTEDSVQDAVNSPTRTLSKQNAYNLTTLSRNPFRIRFQGSQDGRLVLTTPCPEQSEVVVKSYPYPTHVYPTRNDFPKSKANSEAYYHAADTRHYYRFDRSTAHFELAIETLVAANQAELPPKGKVNYRYYLNDTRTYYRWTGGEYTPTTASIVFSPAKNNCIWLAAAKPKPQAQTEEFIGGDPEANPNRLTFVEPEAVETILKTPEEVNEDLDK